MVRRYFLPLTVLILSFSVIPVGVLAGGPPSTCYPPLSLATTSIPSGTAGSSYTVTLAGNGGQPPYFWSFGHSSLPKGFSIDSNGDVTGTPMSAGTYTFDVVLSDSLKDNVMGGLTLTVAAAPTPPPTTPPPTTPPPTTPPPTTPPPTTPPPTTPPPTTPPPTTPPPTTPPPTTPPPTTPPPPTPPPPTTPPPTTDTVETPTFSVSAGAVTPGTAVTVTSATAGATVYCTNSTTESAPATPAYNNVTYMPSYGSQTYILGTAGTDGIVATHAFQPSFAIYGPMQISCMAAKSGMADSAVGSASYTLSGPTGTPISACTTNLTGTNYLTTDVSSGGTCFGIGAANTTLNLNGHTITYGTDGSTLLSGTGTATAGSTTFTCSGCTFTSAMTGDKIFADDYNTGGFQNTADTTTITYVNPTTVTMSAAPRFSSANAEFFIAGPASHAIACDPSMYGPCTASQVYNGTITQGVGAAPQSNAIEVNPRGYGGANGPFVWANLTINVSQAEAEAIHENETVGADLIANNTIHDSVTQIYYRDGLKYPIKLDNGGKAATTPVKTVENNIILGSPQGGIYAYYTTNVLNNFVDSGPVQYSNGFCEFAATNGSVFRGNSCLGDTQGVEMEASNVIYQNNYGASTSSATVQDPNHNPIGCNLNYGFRMKDFASSASIMNVLLDSNVFNDSAGTCGASDIEFSLVLVGDSATVSNNVVTMDFPSVPPSGQNSSALLSADSGQRGQSLAAITYSDNTLSRTGTYASKGYDLMILYDGAMNWTVPGLQNPQILYWQGPSASRATFSGAGTPACTVYGGNGALLTATWNGSALACR